LQEVDPRINFIKVRSNLNWDEYFMLQAMMASYKSKDPNTKVGCVFVDSENRQVTMGYNGAIAGIDETKIPWGNDRRVSLEYQKYGYVMHAEANAIAHCSRNLKGTRGYVTHFPCNECAKLIASQRVEEVIFLSDKHRDSQENRISKKLFNLAGVRYRQLQLSEELIGGLNHYLLSLIIEASEGRE